MSVAELPATELPDTELSETEPPASVLLYRTRPFLSASIICLCPALPVSSDKKVFSAELSALLFFNAFMRSSEAMIFSVLS